MKLKLFVLCNIWILGVAADFETLNMPDMLFQKTVYDRATFTDKVLTCHVDCGDQYYTCSFVTCDLNSHENFKAKKDRDDHSKVIKGKPSLWSKLLYFFSAGFLGETSNDGILNEDKSFEDIDFDEVCLKNCTSVFRECFHKCICDANANAPQCQPAAVYPQTFAPLLRDRHGDLSDSNRYKTSYSFDWSKIS